MLLRVLAFWCVLVLGCSLQGLAQQPTVPATLEGLLNSGETQESAATVEAGETEAGPKRPAGTVTRPKDGAQHPDLDKAWADYDAAVAKAAGGIRVAISKQFDAATAKGDLDEAEKWQASLERFENAVELPPEKEIKAAVSATVADCKKAREELAKAYEAVVRNLTMEKKIAEAKLIRDELQIVGTVVKPAKSANQGEGRGILQQISGEWVIRYSNGTNRRYFIKEDGQVEFGSNRGRLTARSGFFILDFQDGKLERIQLDGGRLIVEHYNPANTFGRSRPDCTGAGERE